MNLAISYSSESLQPFVHALKQSKRIDLYIKGVKCGHCVHKIEKELNSEPYITQHRFELGGHRLSLWADKSSHFISAIDRVQSLGFEVLPLQKNQSMDLKRAEFKTDLKKLAVAGVTAGNIMLFSTAIYLGADEEFMKFFHKMSLFLVLPTLIYSASSIWRGFYASLRYRTFNLDFPIGLALLFGFFLSLYSLLVGGEQIYFDSISVVVFLILASRMILNRHVNQIYQNNVLSLVPGVFQARKLNDDQEALVAIDQIVPGDRVRVYRSEVIPVDGRLITNEAILDESVVSGESSPVVLEKGNSVQAGSRLCFDYVDIEVVRVGAQTTVGRSIKKAINSVEKSKEEGFQIVSRFTLFVLGSSFAVFFYYLFSGELSLAFERSFAIVIVACPCAVSFGIPLIRSFTGRLALKKGILLKDPKVIKNIESLNHICFDKTGTLTHSRVAVKKEDFVKFSHDEQESILALELSMDHPISNGFIPLQEDSHKLPDVTDFKYLAGKGISGKIGGETWDIQGLDSKDKKLGVYRSGNKLGEISLDSQVKDGLSTLFSDLAKRGKKISLLSGDEKSQVQAIFKMVPDSAKGDCLFAAKPEDKLKFIEESQDCLMVGDGVNDVEAMQKASLSVCMPGALENNLNISDILLSKGSLDDFRNLFRISQKVRSTEARLFAFTFIYNVLCVLLAATGWISPVVAAILMPISSITVLSLVSINLRRL